VFYGIVADNIVAYFVLAIQHSTLNNFVNVNLSIRNKLFLNILHKEKSNLLFSFSNIIFRILYGSVFEFLLRSSPKLQLKSLLHRKTNQLTVDRCLSLYWMRERNVNHVSKKNRTIFFFSSSLCNILYHFELFSRGCDP